jgi:hypothetical protein
MAGETGRGKMTCTFAGQAIPQITNMEWVNSADEITTETADGTLSDPGSPKNTLRVSFVFPTTASHTLENAIDAGTTGALTADIGNTRYTNAAAKSLGYSKSSAPTAHIAGVLNITMDGEPTRVAVP